MATPQDHERIIRQLAAEVLDLLNRHIKTPTDAEPEIEGRIAAVITATEVVVGSVLAAFEIPFDTFLERARPVYVAILAEDREHREAMR